MLWENINYNWYISIKTITHLFQKWENIDYN